MFHPSSRYAQLPTLAVPLPNGATALAIKLRRLPSTPGTPYVVQQHDRLDLLAHDQLGDGTQFWRIADANSALEANHLVAQPASSLLMPPS